MRAFAIVVAVVLAAVGVGIGAEAAAGPPPAPRDVWVIVTRQPVIRVLASQPCPPTVGRAEDVAPIAASASAPLVPAEPDRALVCRYGSRLNPGGGLYRTTRLARATAVTLARAVDAVSTRPPHGAVNCPADVRSVTIIAFGYEHRPDADLWYADSGCQTLDNGVVSAFELANRAFYGRFVPLLDRLSPPRQVG